MASTTTTTTTDPADEAGGEVIFSSDGVSPVAVTKPPVVVQEEPNRDSILDSDDFSPSHAFEVFSGKVYSVTTHKTSSIHANAGNSKETPLQRLARLQTEVKELEAELTSTSSNEGRDFDQELVKLASQLQARLTTAASARMPPQDELTRLIQSQMELAKQGGTATTTTTSTTTSSLTATGIVYELYGTSLTPTTSLEDRLTHMERLVGSSATTHKSLLRRLEELEGSIASINSTSLEQASLKAKVIRADLEAASKARNKLTATYKKEDSKTIQQLHQQMMELEGLSQHLPSLTQRLQQLATLHVQSASFATRLLQTEEQAAQVAASVAHLERTLGQVQSQVLENVATVDKNLQVLDERLKKL